MKSVSFRVTVISLFTFLALFIMLFLGFTQSYHSGKLAEKIMSDNFRLLSTHVDESLQESDKINSFFIDSITSSFADVKDVSTIALNPKIYIKALTNILRSHNLYAAYFAFADESFFEIIKVSIDKNLRDQYKLKENADWLLIFIEKNANIKTLRAYDNSLRLLEERKELNSYRPTSRPWYQDAINRSGTLIKSDPYTFQHIDSKGVTYAKEFNSGVIFAIDVLLHNIEKNLRDFNSASSMNSFLFSANQTLVASSSDDKVLIEEMRQLFKGKNISVQEPQIFSLQSQKQILYLSPLPNSEEVLITLMPLKQATLQYERYFRSLHIIFIFLFIFLLPLIWYFASIIVRPVLALKEQSEKVKNREYAQMQQVSSRVLELQSLSNAMTDMAASIQDYQLSLEAKVEERTQELQEKNMQLERLSITDKLTNIYNRIKLDKSIEEEIERSHLHNISFAVIILDVDYFKKVNDTYGHQVGDTTLIEIASILVEHTQKEYTVGRWGGEEFVIVCPNTNLDDVMNLAEKLRKKIEEHNFPIVGHKTASFGVAVYHNGETLETLMNRADEGLYKAKEKGRNRVETSASNT